MRRDLIRVPAAASFRRIHIVRTSQPEMYGAVGGSLLGLLVLSCDKFDPPGADPVVESVASARSSGRIAVASARASALAVPLTPSADAVPEAPVAPPAEPPPHPGPWLTLLSPSAAIYSAPSAEKSSKLGYVQSGARIPVTGKPKPGDKCNSGWIEVVGGGFICSAAGTLDEKDSRAKFTIRRPNLESVLPYTYARNTKNGTPLYRTVPTLAQMLEYEPYLKKDAEPKESDKKASSTDTEKVAENGAATTAPQPSATAGTPKDAASSAGTQTNNSGSGATESVPVIQAATGVPPGNEASEEKPWWQRDGIDDKLHELRLDDLKQDSDGILALRMVKGFYVAVDRTFHWHGRTWYKTTKGLVAPADRMGQASPSDFHGVELGADFVLPVGWVYGGREKTQTYEIDAEKKRVKPMGTVARFQPIALADATQEIGGTVYRQMKDGKWVKQAHLRVPEPGPAPTELRPGERWVDVDLSTQTLVVFEGNTPIYATLVSTGKSSKIKDKDHSTPTGQWRIREKHISTTMDGDGTAAGDQPYSIEDVPFVMYFNKSYAIHAAFWHRNYGVQMSHGCVNLAPLDAKAVFSKTEPSLPSEWHGAWSSGSRPGSWVSVHD